MRDVHIKYAEFQDNVLPYENFDAENFLSLEDC